MQSYIFGGDTGRTLEDIRRQRAVADQLRGGKPQIRTLADGINSAGRDIAAALLSRSASRKEREGTEAATQRYHDLIGSMLASPQAAAAQPASTQAAVTSQPLPQDEVVPGLTNARMDAAISGDDTRSQVAEMLLGKGYSPTVTAGLLGNIQQESNFDTSAVGDNGNSFGMAQWNGPRRHAFKTYAAERGMDPASVEAQVGFLDHELQGSENAALQAMQGAATPEEAALIGSQKFWRPGIPHNDKRQRYAADIANLLRSPEQPTQAAQAQPAPTQPQPASAAQQPPQGDIAQLLMAAQDPFMSPQQQQMIELLLQREMREPETMSPFQQAQTERFARQDNLAERRFQAQLDGRLNSGTSVNINNGDGLPLPKPQQGWQYIRDEQTGGVRLAPIPGGPAEREIASAEEAATNAADRRLDQSSVVLEDIGRFRDLVQQQSWFDPVTGVGGLVAGWLPGSSAANADALAQTIKSNIGFDQLQSMREASPTGGALGNVTERELADLQAVLGNLSRSQSEEQLLYNLERLDRQYRKVMEKAAAYPNAAEFGFGASPERSGIAMPDDLTKVSDEDLRKLLLEELAQ